MQFPLFYSLKKKLFQAFTFRSRSFRKSLVISVSSDVFTLNFVALYLLYTKLYNPWHYVFIVDHLVKHEICTFILRLFVFVCIILYLKFIILRRKLLGSQLWSVFNHFWTYDAVKCACVWFGLYVPCQIHKKKENLFFTSLFWLEWLRQFIRHKLLQIN